MLYPLIAERLSIRPLNLSDVDSFVEYRRDPEIARFQSWETTYAEEDARELIDSQDGVSIPEKGQWLQLAIHHRISGELLGDLALHSVSEGDAVFELGFTIAKAHQCQGFAKEAALTLMNYLSAEIGVTKFVASTDRRNTASIKLLVALGFTRKPLKSWNEHFKNEIITMDYFETH